MSKPKLVGFGLLVLAGMAALLFWQQKALQRVESDNAQLRQRAAELEALRDENARLARSQIDPQELDRLRKAQSELVRLRGEIAQLRRQLADAQQQRARAAAERPPAADTNRVPTVESFLATANPTLQWKQTLALGGWTTASGKHTVFLVQPEPGEQPGQVMLQSKIIELPEAALTQIGLEGLKTDNRLSSSHKVLTAEQADAMLKALEQAEGVNVLAAPKVLTADGRQAQVKVGNLVPTPSGEQVEVGPSLDLVPQVSADGTAVTLTVTARLQRLPSSPR